MTSTTAPRRKIRIWQENLNKSITATFDLLNRADLHKNWDILLIQEPYIDTFKNAKATRAWTVIYPTDHLNRSEKTRSLILVNSRLSTNDWR
ncbi:hypothetical protein NEOLEDRAFT_1075620, partial [Neolentinus lepideus HHB14362 ss-1]